MIEAYVASYLGKMYVTHCKIVLLYWFLAGFLVMTILFCYHFVGRISTPIHSLLHGYKEIWIKPACISTNIFAGNKSFVTLVVNLSASIFLSVSHLVQTFCACFKTTPPWIYSINANNKDIFLVQWNPRTLWDLC